MYQPNNIAPMFNNPSPAFVPQAQRPPTPSGSPIQQDQPVDVETVALLGASGDVFAAYKTILAWGILLMFLYVVGKTRWGYAAIYYSEVLILLFLFATQAQFFREKLSPITKLTQPTGP